MNNSKKKFSIKKRIRSFRFAFRGIRLMIRTEHNAWIHCFVTVCVVIAGFFFRISEMEWIVVILAIGSVFAAEALNTAIETLCDYASLEYREAIKHTKDLAAGGVLLMVIAAVIAGLIIFLPKFIALIQAL